MSRYASETSVSVEKSRADIEKTLSRYGATAFAYGWDQTTAVVQFQINNRHVRLNLPMPTTNSDDVAFTPSGKVRPQRDRPGALEQVRRSRWRALLLVIKAKLEAVEVGIVTFEEEFMAHIVLPNGSTVGDFMAPQIEVAYDTGGMPALLPRGN